MNDVKRPVIAGIHHLKLPVSDLAASLKWWEQVFGAERVPEADHVMPDGTLFAYILKVPALGAPLELRLAPEKTVKEAQFDSVTLAVHEKADLDAWVNWLDTEGVENSRVLRGLAGWLLVVRDPDGLPIRIYCHETHEWDTEGADHDSSWLD
jgi:catechol 2,3-dioxygenase-like lactoylglutathione lyase family enzyme